MTINRCNSMWPLFLSDEIRRLSPTAGRLVLLSRLLVPGLTLATTHDVQDHW